MLRDTIVAATLEAGLLSLAGLLAFIFHAPLLFTSLGPTAYELIETPMRPSARPYNILVGHGIGLLSGLFALTVTGAWQVPALSLHGLLMRRVAAVAIAGCLTVVGTLMLRATQPAALSTTLLVALGTMQTRSAVACIVAGVLLMVAVGEPIRRLRATRTS